MLDIEPDLLTLSGPQTGSRSEGPHKILSTAQSMLDIETDLLTLSGPKTGSRSVCQHAPLVVDTRNVCTGLKKFVHKIVVA